MGLTYTLDAFSYAQHSIASGIARIPSTPTSTRHSTSMDHLASMCEGVKLSRLTSSTDLLQYTKLSAFGCAKALHTLQHLQLQTSLQLVCC